MMVFDKCQKIELPLENQRQVHQHSAEQANGQMIITIQDDGKGIDSEKVAQKALEKGQIDENQYMLWLIMKKHY